MSKSLRDACGRFSKGPSQDPPQGPSQGPPKGPSQGQPKGPSQGQPEGPSQGQPGGPSQGHSVASATEVSRAPSAASFFGKADLLSDSDNESVVSVSDTGSMEIEGEDSRSRKRAFLKDGSEGSSGSVRSGNKKPRAKKSVVAADTHDVGLSVAQRQLNLARRAQVQQDLEERVEAKERGARVARGKSGYGASRVLYADHSLVELQRMAEEDEEEIAEVASKSSNLKGTLQKSLKCRAASMRCIVAELVQRKASDETQQLQAKVDRLQSEVSQLHQKLAEATARPSQAGPRPPAEGPSSSNLEDIIRKVVMEERAFTRACIAGIEDRLLPEQRVRPPLAADKRSVEKRSVVQSEPGPSRAEDALLPSTTPSNEWTEVVKKGKAKKAAAAVPAVPATSPASQSHPTTGKGKGKGKKSAPKPTTAAQAAKGAPAGTRKNLVPPKTAAVVVTLTAEAAAQGETYASVMQRARANVDPTQLGIGKVSCRRTQAGARIFEFPGADGKTSADLFATKLQEVIADVAKVARPVKMAALEVNDLDDSVTREEVVAAVAAIGGCDVAAVQDRGIRPGRGGLGTIRLECPVAAAKAVLDKGRLAVGFSSGAVRALEAQPLRCFRCFGIGHTRALCPSSVDRSGLCYRCGKEGHKAASCKAATPHCAVCAASGRPAGHMMTGRNCSPPPKKGKAQASIRPVAATVVPVAGTSSSAAVEGGAMSD